MSVKSPTSDADNPIAVSPSVTMSDAFPKSKAPTVAKLRTPDIPSVICVAFHPAIPIYDMASATSVAEYLVTLPQSLAVCVNLLNSVSVAPVIALTFAISFSKAIPSLAIKAKAPPAAAPNLVATPTAVFKS